MKVQESAPQWKSTQRLRLGASESLSGSMGCLAQQEHLPLGAVPQTRAQRQKAGHSRRRPHYPDHPLPYVEEPTTVSRSWAGLLRSAKCRATQALANPQARAPRFSSHCSEPSFLSHRNSLSIFSREPYALTQAPLWLGIGWRTCCCAKIGGFLLSPCNTRRWSIPRRSVPTGGAW